MDAVGAFGITGEVEMLCRAVVGFCVLLTISFLNNSLVYAQSAPADDISSPSPVSPKSMDPPTPGDHWTYELRDLITGVLKSTGTYTITDVTPREIGVRVEFLGSSAVVNNVFDHDWNLVSMLPWKYSPNDGQGIKQPLTPGSKWKFSNEATNTQSGASFRNSGTAEVLSNESVTTAAGTFDAYRIETSVSVINTKYAAFNAVKKLMSWYAPAVSRWVKQTTTISANGHVTSNTSVELVDYGRRQ